MCIIHSTTETRLKYYLSFAFNYHSYFFKIRSHGGYQSIILYKCQDLQPALQNIQLAQCKLMKRLTCYIWIKGIILLNVSTTRQQIYVAKKCLHQPFRLFLQTFGLKEKTQYRYPTCSVLGGQVVAKTTQTHENHAIEMLRFRFDAFIEYFYCMYATLCRYTVMYQLLGR